MPIQSQGGGEEEAAGSDGGTRGQAHQDHLGRLAQSKLVNHQKKRNGS